jgi:uncharacterized membrane protein YfcA
VTEAAAADFVLVFGVVTAAYFIRGLTGFGSGLISVPLLALWQPLHFVVPLVMTLDFIASFVLGGVNTRQTDWSEIKRLLPFGIIGASFGVFALLRFPSAGILVALGLFTMYFGFRSAFGIVPAGTISSLWAVPAGLLGSGAGALFGTSGPPYIIYLTHRLQDKTTVRATFSWLFVLDGGFRLALIVVAGLLAKFETQVAIMIGLIPMAAGLYLGNRVHVGISRERLLRAIGWILVVSGAALMIKVTA